MAVRQVTPAVVRSVNVGRPRHLEWRGRQVTTAIWKEPVSGAIHVKGVNLEGDDQADRRVHGGADKAVYAYAAEDYHWWSTQLGRLGPGTFGENLTTVGLDLAASLIGDRWHVGSAILEVSQPRTPCFKLGIRMADDAFPAKFAAAGRTGAYLRIVQAGLIEAGDQIRLERATPPLVSIGALARGELTAGQLAMLSTDDRVPEVWRRAAKVERARQAEHQRS
ncbi:MAG: MOSC domain-containing protein [Actinomycetota bacterium]